MKIEITRLEINDLNKLYEFELNNRNWFESLIEKREDSFYQLENVHKHISECLKAFQNETMYPMLIKDFNQAIIGRVNLHKMNMKTKTAWLGYRIAQSEAGKGVATVAARKIIDIADKKLKLNTIRAIVSVENYASQRVLEKLHFKCTGQEKNKAFICDKLLDCYQYERELYDLSR